MQEYEHDLLAGHLFVTLSTKVGHIVDEDGVSACERFEYDLDDIESPEQGRVYYKTPYRGKYGAGLIHEDDTWRPHTVRLCANCNEIVPNGLQEQLFSDEFSLVDDLSTE